MNDNTKTIIVNSETDNDRIKFVLKEAGIECLDIYDTKSWIRCNEAFSLAFIELKETILRNYNIDFNVEFKDIYTRDLLDSYSSSIIKERILKFIRNNLSWKEELEMKNSDTQYIVSTLEKDIDFNSNSEILSVVDVLVRKNMSGEKLWNRDEILESVKKELGI